MSIFVYVLKHNPEGVADMLRKYGFSVSKDPSQNVEKLKTIVRQFGDEALSEIASIHPDRELILSHANIDMDKKSSACGGDGDHEFSNCSGCGGSCGCSKKTSNAEGEQPSQTSLTKELPVKPENPTPVFNSKPGIDKGILFLLGSIVIIGALVINSRAR